jgi:hypothetical protein
MMPARPRVGDGYAQAYRNGAVEDRGRIVAVDERVAVPAGEYDDLVLTEQTTAREPGLVERTYYARGVGVILEEEVAGGSAVVELVELVEQRR